MGFIHKLMGFVHNVRNPAKYKELNTDLIIGPILVTIGVGVIAVAGGLHYLGYF